MYYAHIDFFSSIKISLFLVILKEYKSWGVEVERGILTSCIHSRRKAEKRKHSKECALYQGGFTIDVDNDDIITYYSSIYYFLKRNVLCLIAVPCFHG